MCALVTGVQTCALPISCADVAREPVYPLKLWIILWMEGGCPPPLQTRRARYRSVQKPHNGERYLLPSDSDVPCSACAGSLLPSSSSSISAMSRNRSTTRAVTLPLGKWPCSLVAPTSSPTSSDNASSTCLTA